MKRSEASVILSFLALAFLVLLRFAGARVIVAAVPVPYGAGMISALGVLMVIAFALVIDRLVRVFYWDGYLRRKRKRNTPALIEDILTIALVVLGASIGLFFEAGVSFAGLLTASGATAIVLGIALQAVIQDVFSGLSLNFDGSYAIGDWLTIYSEHFPEPVYGQVQGITWRTTFLHLPDGRRLMVPNHLMTSNPVMNHSRPSGPKRLIVEFPVSNNFSGDRAMSILLGEAYRAVRDTPLAQEPEPDILIDRFDSDSAFFHIRFWADPNEVNPQVAQSLMATAMHRAAQSFKVPSPVTQVQLVPLPDDHDTKRMEARDALGHVPIFKDVLDVRQLDALFSACVVRTLPSDTVFIRQGDTGTSMFVILEGATRVSILAQGEARSVAVLVAGDIVGELSLMTGEPRTATVTSLTSVSVLEVTKQSIETLLKDTPELLDKFGQVLAARQLGLKRIATIKKQEESDEWEIVTRMRAFFSNAFS
jgi:small-conductance mechanosensitive channel